MFVNSSGPGKNLPEGGKYQSAEPLLVDVVPPDSSMPQPSGRLIFIDNAVDPSTGTIRLRAEFENSEAALWPGQFVNVSLQLYEQPDAIVIPSQAVQTGPDGPYVYGIGADTPPELRRIK